jgi:hypothetical protein
VSFLDVINGRQPLLRSTSRRNNIATIEQDYASLASKGGGPFYLNSECSNVRFDRQELDPTYHAIEPRGLNEEALKSLMRDRDKSSARICFVTMFVPILGGAKADIICSFPFPVNRIWIASKSSAEVSNSLYLSLEPLFKYPPAGNPAGSSVTPNGSEHWFDMSYYAQGTNHLGKMLHLEHYVQVVYFTVGFENGGNVTFTVAGSNGEVIDTMAAQMGVAI